MNAGDAAVVMWRRCVKCSGEGSGGDDGDVVVM